MVALCELCVIEHLRTCGARCLGVEREYFTTTGTTGRLPKIVQNAPKREWWMVKKYPAHALLLENGM